MAIKSELIMAKVLTEMRKIKIANGYNADLGSYVAEWKLGPLNSSDPYFLNVMDTDIPRVDELTQASSGRHRKYSQYQFEIKCSDPQTLRKCVADVNKVIGLNTTWGGYAILTKPLSEQIDTGEQNEYKLIGKTILIEVQYDVVSWQSE